MIHFAHISLKPAIDRFQFRIGISGRISLKPSSSRVQFRIITADRVSLSAAVSRSLTGIRIKLTDDTGSMLVDENDNYITG